MRARLITAIACLACLASAARADAPIATVEAAADTASADPGEGHLVVSSTALTQPAGTLNIESHMGLTGVVYGVNRRLEIGGYVLPLFVVVKPVSFSGAVTAKLAAIDRGPIRVAFDARAGTLELGWWYAEASAIATGCLDHACTTQVTAGATLGMRRVTGSSDDGRGPQRRESRLAIGAQVRLADHVALVADLAWARETDVHGGTSDGVLLAPGIRVHGRAWMVQASVAGEAISRFALPWVSAAYRY